MAIVISFAGHPNSGKTSAVHYIHENYGFTPVSPPDLIREYARDNDIDLAERWDWARTRGLMTKEFGADWLLQRVLDRTKQSLGRVAVDGLSTLYDHDALKAYGNIVIALLCPHKIGFERGLQRGDHSKDRSDYNQYRQDILREAYNDDPHKMNRQRIIDLADHRIDASGSLEVVHSEINGIVGSIVRAEHTRLRV